MNKLNIDNDILLCDKLKPDDRNFIINSWLQSYYGCSATHHIKRQQYYIGQRDIINNILESPITKTIFIRPIDWEDGIIGYVIYNSNTIHYFYVKNVYRKMGLASKLLDTITKLEDIKYISHFKEPHTRFYVEKYNLTYNPYLAWI